MCSFFCYDSILGTGFGENYKIKIKQTNKCNRISYFRKMQDKDLCLEIFKWKLLSYLITRKYSRKEKQWEHHSTDEKFCWESFAEKKVVSRRFE